MENNYYKAMKLKESECASAMRNADIAYEQYGGHCEEECKYLQQAAKLHYEMAQMNIGSQALYHKRRIQELNTKIKDIMREIDPDRYSRIVSSEKKEDETKKTGENSASSAAAAALPKKNNSQTLNAKGNINVEDWFKPAPPHSFADVSGMAELKEILLGCIADTKLTKIREFLGIKKLNSYFFIGPPGCGKTYIIEAFAHELMEQDYKYISLVGSDILNSYVGVAEKIITRLFEEAKKNAPCIVFIDEIDGVCRNRSDDMPEYMASMTNAFLTGYNDIKNSNKNIIFIGATNYPERVDDAMLDRVEVIRVNLPDEEARKFAVEKEFKNIIEFEDGFSVEEIASDAYTKDYNYRDIERLTTKMKTMVLTELMEQYGDQELAIEALKNKQYLITRELFEKAKEECKLVPKTKIEESLDKWMKKFKDKTENDGIEEVVEEVSKSQQTVESNSVNVYQELERLVFNINVIMENAAKTYMRANELSMQPSDNHAQDRDVDDSDESSQE